MTELTTSNAEEYLYQRDYRYILKHYTEDDIRERIDYFESVSNDVINTLNLQGKARINWDLLGEMICSYFADTIRLKEFHGIAHTNKEKRIAYSLYWFLRCKPVQLLTGVPRFQLYVNEKIAAAIIFSEYFYNFKDSNSDEQINDLMKQFLYHFKYRHLDAQDIEMSLVALACSTRGA